MSRAFSGRFVLIEHLRGASALAVTLFHAFGSTYGTTLWAPLQQVAAVAEFGWQGVHVFFVLSGFCIAEKIASLGRNGRGACDFLRDRFWRIMPAYWAALLICVALGLLAAPFNGKPLHSAFPPSTIAWLTDFTLVQHWFRTPSLLLVSWTLAFEAAFYVLAAFLLAIRPKIGARGILAAGCGLTLLCFALPGREFDTPLTYWPEFWLGFLAHAFVQSGHHWKGALTVTALGLAAQLFPDHAMGQVHLIAVACAASLVAVYPYDAELARWPYWRWLGITGAWSYSLYLIHVPILSRLINLGRRIVPADSPTFAILVGTALATTLTSAWLFSRLIEAPLERWRRRPRVSLAAIIP